MKSMNVRTSNSKILALFLAVMMLLGVLVACGKDAKEAKEDAKAAVTEAKEAATEAKEAAKEAATEAQEAAKEATEAAKDATEAAAAVTDAAAAATTIAATQAGTEAAADQNAMPAAKIDPNKKTVTVTTSFLYDMVKVLAPDMVNLQLIIPAGEDPHLYNALPEDKIKLQEADLVLYHGLHFEGKMVEALEAVGKEVSANFPQEKIGQMDEDGQQITDPHFWFDLELYGLATQSAADALIELLPDQADAIKANNDKYQQELKDLDAWIKEEVAKIPEDSRILITPHDAFNYFSRAYNIKVEAPQGVSTEGEVSTQDMLGTVDTIVNNKVKAIFAESTTDPARMKKLQEACAAKGFEVKVVSGEGNELFSDSLAPEGQPGDNFLDMYKHNVELIVSNLA